MSSIEVTSTEPQYAPLRRFSSAVPRLEYEWLQSAECTDDLRGAVNMLRELARNESPEGELLINRGRALAIPSYQFNSNHSARFRKTRLTGEPLNPYSIHPVKLALHGMGYPAHLVVSIDGIISTLDAVQAPYDARIITAKLLHDCPEDVKGIDGYGEIPNMAAWEWLIKSNLLYSHDGKGPELDTNTVNDVWDIVHAVTKPSPSEVIAMRPEILCDAHTRDIISYFQDRVPGEIREEIPKQIVDGIAARHMFLLRTMGNDYARLGAIYAKTVDNTDNMNTLGTKLGKLYIAHSNAELARVMELPIATVTLFGLSKNAYSTGENLGSPNESLREKRTRAEYIAIERDRYDRRREGRNVPQMHLIFPGSDERHSYEISANQLPVMTRAERNDSISADPALQFVVPIKDEDLLRRIIKSQTLNVTYDKSRSGFTSRRIRSSLHRELGIAIFEANAAGTGRTAFYTKFIDGSKPTGHDALMRGSTANASDVPGMKLLAKFDGSLAFTLSICERFSPLK